MTPSLNLDFVRSQFPAFSEPSLQGQAFFDNAGGSYACKHVIDRLTNYYKETKLQPYHLHPASQKAGQHMDESYNRLAEYLNIEVDEVHLGPSTSQNTYVLANAFANILHEGDEIVVTNQDHEANSGVWRRLAKKGIIVKEWKVDPLTGTLDVSQLDVLFTSKTKLLLFPHCSNLVAHINPVAEICHKAKLCGVRTVVDGVSYAGHELPNVGILGADIYLFSLYKVYGPHIGVMAIRSDMAEELGNQSHYFNGEYKHKWFVPAGPDHAQVAASQGVMDYFDALHDYHYSKTADVQEKAQRIRSLMHAAETPLLSQVLSFVDKHPQLTLIGPSSAQERAAVISLVPKNQTPQQLALALTKKGIICGAGHFYAVRLLEAMGIDPETGVVRLSFVHYTSQNEIDQLLNALEDCVPR